MFDKVKTFVEDHKEELIERGLEVTGAIGGMMIVHFVREAQKALNDDSDVDQLETETSEQTETE